MFKLTKPLSCLLNGSRLAKLAYSSLDQSKKCLDISGIYPPLATPFLPNEDLDWKNLAGNIEKWNKVPFRGYVVGGSTGEYVYLTEEEKIKMIEMVKTLASKEKLIIAGSGCESARDTIKMTEKVSKAGADATLVVTPSYYKGKMDNASLISYYTKVADASPIPVILYNVPPNTSIELNAEVAIKMAEHPNVIGLKDSGGDITKLGLMVHKTHHLGFQVLAGSAGHMYPAYMMGCVGGVFALANSLGEPICDLENLIKKGELKGARQLQYRLIQPNYAVTKIFGVPGVKKSMEFVGLHGGHTRSPLLPLEESKIGQLKTLFSNEGFISE